MVLSSLLGLTTNTSAVKKKDKNKSLLVLLVKTNVEIRLQGKRFIQGIWKKKKVVSCHKVMEEIVLGGCGGFTMEASEIQPERNVS